MTSTIAELNNELLNHKNQVTQLTNKNEELAAENEKAIEEREAMEERLSKE